MVLLLLNSSKPHRACLFVSLSVSLFLGLYLLARRFHPSCCCLLVSSSPSPSVALLLCLLENKPVLQLSSVLDALQAADGSSSSSCCCKGVYLAARVSPAAAQSLQRRLEGPPAGGPLSPDGRPGALPEGFFVLQETATDWKFLVLHLAAAAAAAASSRSSSSLLQLDQQQQQQQQHHGNSLVAALQRLSPSGVSVSSCLYPYLMNPTERDRKHLFAGCLSLALNVAAYKRLTQLFR